MFRVLSKALAALVVATPLLADTDDSNMSALFNQEARALNAASAAHLQRLVTPASANGSSVKAMRYDTAWLANQSIEATGDAWQCLTEALYFEARGETLRGQFAVAEVILNRVDSPRYPGTVCGVVNQSCQFSYTCDGHPESMSETAARAQVGKVAALMLEGAPRELTEGATHYHTVAVNPRWASEFPMTTQIGVHRFYRQPLQISMN
ncbi:cell wall hydrolase SleB [Roseivivax halodurans JCM 10272]|uniref:Cell wall hydrolase SleB n=1 Tax=Roseivivax halodurans JCM 10272 TaxID=1449350 RepID=X7EL43_9RHOB|nr:cell wall hydrolase [Roseivivax halodurans]ETX16647.1 cell wall hydrolase SleB [Roseivivax halodurans JCM 10272]